MAPLFLLVLPYCFDARSAKAHGLAGLRREAGGRRGNRPHHAMFLEASDYGVFGGLTGPRPDMPAIYDMMMRHGIISREQLIEMARHLDYGTAAQQALFKMHKERRFKKRADAQAEMFRDEIARRRAARMSVRAAIDSHAKEG